MLPEDVPVPLMTSISSAVAVRTPVDSAIMEDVSLFRYAWRFNRMSARSASVAFADAKNSCLTNALAASKSAIIGADTVRTFLTCCPLASGTNVENAKSFTLSGCARMFSLIKVYKLLGTCHATPLPPSS